MDICKANHGLECIKCTQGSCDNRHELDIPMPDVKEPKKSAGRLTVDVEVNGIDEAIKKAEKLNNMYADIDILQRRIIAGAERVEQIVRRCYKAKEGAECESGGRPKESYREYMESKQV